MRTIIKKTIVSASIFIPVALCILAILAEATASRDNHSDYTDEIGFFGVLFFSGLFLLNLLICVFRRKQRSVHVVINVLIIALFFIFVYLVRQSIEASRRWFIQSEHLHYERIVGRIMQNRSMLTNENKLFYQFSDYPFSGRWGVVAGIDNDGFVYIQFPGRGNNARNGYLYYPGDKMVVASNNPRVCFFATNTNYFYVHLTNSWYEYSN